MERHPTFPLTARGAAISELCLTFIFCMNLRVMQWEMGSLQLTNLPIRWDQAQKPAMGRGWGWLL